MHTASALPPVCVSCGHVMQPVGPRVLHEQAIGGAPVAVWSGDEFECVCCRTRVALTSAAVPPMRPGSVGYEAIVASREALSRNPAWCLRAAEHLPADVHADQDADGAPRQLSQRQVAARIVHDFFEQDTDEAPLMVLLRLAEVLDVDVDAALHERGAAILREVGGSGSNYYTAENGASLAYRDAEGRIVGEPDDESWEDERAQAIVADARRVS